MKYFKISATLGAIALVCALLIALINLVTNPVIETNDKTTELNTCKDQIKMKLSLKSFMQRTQVENLLVQFIKYQERMHMEQ